MKLKSLNALAALLTVLAPAASLRASLGGDISSVRDDQTKLQGTLRTTSGNSYNIHEIQAQSGTVLREYTSPSGAVFGVAWQGRTHPDLQQVLGAYYDRYLQAVKTQRAQRHGHGPLSIQTPNFVVQFGGHMGALRGKAYLPQSLPAGVRVEDIQ